MLKGSVEFIDFGKKTFKVNIPANMEFGKKLRLKGLAGNVDESFNGQDLLLLLKKEFKTLTSIRKDLIMEFPVELDSIKVSPIKRINLVDRKYDIRIPKTSKYGQLLRMRGLAEIMNGGYPGDILLKLTKPPNNDKGLFNNIIGNFIGFNVPLSEKRFKITFKLFWPVEFSKEWIFRYSESNIHGRYI